MKYSKQLLTLVALMMLAALVACSSGSSSNNNPPPPTTTIAATSGSSQSATTGTAFAAPLVATVSKGGTPVSGASVTFTAPSSGASGTFSNGTATETDTTDSSGKATSTTFTANSTGGAYTVTASVSGASSPANFSLTNNAPATPGLADGTYVFQLSGTYGTGASTTTPSPYFVAGAFTVSGGIITGGEQDFVDALNNEHDGIANTNFIPVATADGNVQVVLTTCTGPCPSTPDPNVGLAGVETLNIAMASATSGRVVEFDTAATSSGTIDVQDSTAAQTAPAGAYIFGIQGWNAAQQPLAMTGILDVSAATLLTTGSVFDLENNYIPFSAQTISAGTVSGPDTSGRVVFGVTPSNTTFKVFNLVGYIVDATHVRIVEGSDQFAGTTGGTAYAQNATAGSLAVSGNSYVVGMTGTDANGVLQAAGVFALGSTGNVGGTISYNDLSPNLLQPAGAITAGTYLADTTYPGRVTLNTVTDGKKTFNLQLYVDGNGNALAMTWDTSQDVLQGVGYLQTSGASFTGTYAAGVTGADPTEHELDAVGSITTGTGTFASTTATGFDLNWISGSSGTVGVPKTNLQVSGAFSAPSSGVSSGTGNTITGLDVTTAANADAFTYYVVNSTTVIAIEADTNQLSLIYFVQ